MVVVVVVVVVVVAFAGVGQRDGSCSDCVGSLARDCNRTSWEAVAGPSEAAAVGIVVVAAVVDGGSAAAAVVAADSRRQWPSRS